MYLTTRNSPPQPAPPLSPSRILNANRWNALQNASFPPSSSLLQYFLLNVDAIHSYVPMWRTNQFQLLRDGYYSGETKFLAYQLVARDFMKWFRCSYLFVYKRQLFGVHCSGSEFCHSNGIVYLQFNIDLSISSILKMIMRHALTFHMRVQMQENKKNRLLFFLTIKQATWYACRRVFLQFELLNELNYF